MDKRFAYHSPYRVEMSTEATSHILFMQIHSKRSGVLEWQWTAQLVIGNPICGILANVLNKILQICIKGMPWFDISIIYLLATCLWTCTSKTSSPLKFRLWAKFNKLNCEHFSSNSLASHFPQCSHFANYCKTHLYIYNSVAKTHSNGLLQMAILASWRCCCSLVSK